MPKIIKEKIDFKYNFKVYLGFLKNYKWTLVVILFLLFLVEASYTVDRYLFKIVIDEGTEFINQNLDYNNYISILIKLLLIFLSILIFRVVIKFVSIHLVNKFEMDLIIDLKRKFFNHIVHLSHRFHTSRKTGSLISRLVRGGSAAERMTDTIIFNISPLVFQLIVVSGSLLYFDLIFSLVVIVTIFSFVGYSIFIQNKQKVYNIIANKKEDIEKAYISDVMTNIDSIKYFGKEDYVKNKFKLLSKITGVAFLRFWGFFSHLDAVQSMILGLGSFFLVLFPLIKLLNGNLSIGSLVFIYTVYGNLIGPLFAFVGGVRNYYGAMSDFQDLFQYIRMENEIKDKPNAKELKIKKGEIKFKNINFSYGKRKIFENFNLKINKNQKVALVGYSGSGKSTLIKLLYRLYNLNEGKILIDGQNIDEFKQESLRSELSIVPQECILFDDTIYKNIAFSKPDATRNQVMKAIKFAQLKKTIEEFPNKEKTVVGERGIRLSAGEKQRVSIARAILANKKVLVLDEATSALDSQTEHYIQKALKILMRKRTSLIVAHRLSTIMHCNKIVVMEKGKIAQIGRHKDLIKVPGIYRRLWNLQKGGYIR